MKQLGIIGGLGPMATAYFLQLIVEMTDAKADQDHIEIIMHSRPQIPDRTQFIIGKSSENPMPQLIDIGKRLVAQGVEVIAIPCITAHFFQKQLEEKIGVYIVNAIEETACYLKSEGISCVGIMATDGTIQSELFQNVFKNYGITCKVPSDTNQAKVMHIIYDNVKAGLPADRDMLEQVSGSLYDMGAEINLFGCTELSVAKRDYKNDCLDVMEVLARKSVLMCGKLKPQYQHLITCD